MHSTHFAYWYMTLDTRLKIIQKKRDETCHHHLTYYTFWLAQRALLYTPLHRQDSTYHNLCYTSHRTLAGMRNSSMGPPWRTDLMTHCTMSECSYHRATSHSETERRQRRQKEERREGRKEMFYLMTHSTHFIYGYMASDIWLRTILILRNETCCCHISYSFWLTARVLLYAPSHRQDSTYHGLCYTSRGALAETRNSSMGSPNEGSIRRPITPWANVTRREKRKETRKRAITKCTSEDFIIIIVKLCLKKYINGRGGGAMGGPWCEWWGHGPQDPPPP